MKIQMVINNDYGGFGLSKIAVQRLKELGMKETKARLATESDNNYEYRNFQSVLDKDRTNPLLVQVVKELGSKASEEGSSLRVIEFDYNPMDLIHYYDGKESLDIHYDFADKIDEEEDEDGD